MVYERLTPRTRTSFVGSREACGWAALRGETGLRALGIVDLVALATFIAGWIGYHLAVETSRWGGLSLNTRMDEQRRVWMLNMLVRENRIVDTTIMASLQNGTAFFASTSLIALGAALTLLRSSDDMIRVFADLGLGAGEDRVAWEMKVLGLVGIFGYAFFKFGWSYRLFNYAAILIGATPVGEGAQGEEARRAAMRAARMSTVAARHFNRGQRAFFFSLAYLGWFVSPWALIAGTAAVMGVMYRRQYGPDARQVLEDAP